MEIIGKIKEDLEELENFKMYKNKRENIISEIIDRTLCNIVSLSNVFNLNTGQVLYEFSKKIIKIMLKFKIFCKKYLYNI